ncbi:unnamed protein product [Linum tenue]|uniref:Filament-like plant protein n=2 Tax=Linum tenue TaxID=586396 RepID=A0AAV0RV91_9ROSI|nr:unnamed protein product [Linum tenue]
MEKRKWLWKKKPSERGGESESSGSISSHSERFSDDQEALKASPKDDGQSPEIISKIADGGDKEVNESIKCLTEKLSAALVNVSQKDDLVKQHSKVGEEAVAGWEKAEKELLVVQKQLEAATQTKSQLEDRVIHLDRALKECVRQLRQARDEQEEKIREAVASKAKEWETIKSELENQLFQLKIDVGSATASKPESPPQVNPDLYHRLEYLEKENETLRLELLSQSEELEVRTIERELSTQAAEMASKQHLESIKKVAKLEAECRRLKPLVSRSSSSLNDHHKTSATSSVYLESLTDSHSDRGDGLNGLISELDQFKNEKTVGNRNLLPVVASAVKINLMDDFLDMERLAALPENAMEINNHVESAVKQSTDHAESLLRDELKIAVRQAAELEAKLNDLQQVKDELEQGLVSMRAEKAKLEESLERIVQEKAQVESNLEEIESEKAEMETALTTSLDKNKASASRLREVQLKLEEVQSQLSFAKESKQEVESHLWSLEAEYRTLSAQVSTLESELEKERAMSAELSIKYQYLEEELSMKKEEFEHQQQSINMNNASKIKQEDLALAAGKLADCQKTILSLGQQLKSLATLEDFLIDASNIPEISVHSSSDKNRNGFAKFFSRSKNGIQLEL